MLNIRQEIHKLLEIAEPILPSSEEQLRVKAAQEAEQARIEQERLEIERLKAQKEALLAKPVELEPGEVPLTKEQREAIAKEEAELAAKTAAENKARWEQEKKKQEEKEKELLAAQNLTKEKTTEGDEEKSNSLKFYKTPSGTAGILRNFFKFFLNHRNLMPALMHSLSTEFSPERDTSFKSAINKILMFYTQFSLSMDAKSPTPYIEDLLLAFGKGFFNTDDTAEHKRFVTNASGLAVTSVRNYIESGSKVIQIPEDALEDDLVNMYVACNIMHFYLLARYYTPTKGYNAGTVRTNLFTDVAKGNHEDQDFLSSWEFKQFNTPSKPALQKFMASKNPFAMYLKDQLGSKEASGIKAAYYDPNTGSKETQALKDRFKSTLAARTSRNANLPTIKKKSVTEATEGDVGSVDVHHEFFLENLTTWFLAIVLLSDPNKVNLPEKTFEHTLMAMSLAATSGESAPGIVSADVHGVSFSDENSNFDLADVTAEDAFAITLETEQLHDTFRSVKQKLEAKFGVSAESTNISSILAGVFAIIPDNFFGSLCEYYKVDSTGNLIRSNLFRDYKTVATSGRGKKLEDDEVSSISKEAIMIEIANLLTFIQDKDNLSATKVRRMMTNLPKTIEEAKEIFSVSKDIRGVDKSRISTDDPIAQQILDWFTEIRVLVPRFSKEISPEIDSPVSPDTLSINSAISKKYGLDLTFAETQGARRKSPVFNWNDPLPVLREKLDAAFDDYYDVIKDILLPTDTSNWGLLKPTPINIKRRNPNALETWIVYPDYKNGKTHTFEVGRKNKTTVDGNIYSSPEEYKETVADPLLNKLKSLKPKFLSAKTLPEIQNILTELISVIPPKEGALFASNPLPILAFKSPDTVQYASDANKTKESILADLIHPEYATDNKTLQDIDTDNPVASVTKASAGQKAVNAFITLARAALVINNLSTQNIQDSIVYNYLQALSEADETSAPGGSRWTTKSNTLLQYSTVNIHLRAQLIVAVAQLFTVICNVLQDINDIAEKLPERTVQPALKISNEFSSFVMKVLIY